MIVVVTTEVIVVIGKTMSGISINASKSELGACRKNLMFWSNVL